MHNNIDNKIISYYYKNITCTKCKKKGGKYMDLNKIKGKLKENNLTYGDISMTLGISRTTFNDKINGKKSFILMKLKSCQKS